MPSEWVVRLACRARQCTGHVRVCDAGVALYRDPHGSVLRQGGNQVDRQRLLIRQRLLEAGWVERGLDLGRGSNRPNGPI